MVRFISNDDDVHVSAIFNIFASLHERRTRALENGMKVPECQISCSFIELYNEELCDLLSSDKDPQATLLLREDANGQVFLTGAKEVNVTSLEGSSLLKGA